MPGGSSTGRPKLCSKWTQFRVRVYFGTRTELNKSCTGLFPPCACPPKRTAPERASKVCRRRLSALGSPWSGSHQPKGPNGYLFDCPFIHYPASWTRLKLVSIKLRAMATTLPMVATIPHPHRLRTRRRPQPLFLRVQVTPRQI